MWSYAPMCVYVCVCVCVIVCMYVYAHVCMYVCVAWYMYKISVLMPCTSSQNLPVGWSLFNLMITSLLLWAIKLNKWYI